MRKIMLLSAIAGIAFSQPVIDPPFADRLFPYVK